MTDNTTSMYISIISEIDTLVQVGKSILGCLQSETISSSRIAERLEDQVRKICVILLLLQKERIEFEILRSWVQDTSKAFYEATELVSDLAASSSLEFKVRCRSLCGLSRSSIERLLYKLSDLEQKAFRLLNRDFVTEFYIFRYFLDELQRVKPHPGLGPADYKMENIVGLEEEEIYCIYKLLDTNDIGQHISVISIFGKGDIGKTMLAKSIYNNEIITDHFDLKLWVYVSKEFQIENIIKSILLSRIGDLGLEQLKDLLKVKISKKLFLLVLDDVWNEDRSKWDKLLSELQVGARGSKILVTTRSKKVAQLCGDMLELPRLNNQMSRLLFTDIYGQEPPENLDDNKPNIIEACAGVPFSIKVVASLLRARGGGEWKDVCSHFFQHYANLTPDLMPFLMLSYDFLYQPLRVCFVYCSLFPRDYDISVNDLVSFWMAQGYVEPNPQKDLEDMAMEHFRDLSNQFFFIDKAMDEFGNVETCKMHDTFRNLALKAAGEWGPTQHLSLFHENHMTSLRENCLKDERKVQSFLHWTEAKDEDGAAGRISINDIVTMSNFKSLRVLDLHAFGLQVLPESIGNLVHLRYLDFSQNEDLLKLPKSITNLYHLQTLKLNFCYELGKLPASIGKLVNLRRLEIDGCERLTFMPLGFKNLSSLRTLSRFVVGRPHSEFSCGFEALGNLSHLRGRLMIELSENWATYEQEAAKSSEYLSNKSRLTELGIKWGHTRSTMETDTVLYKKLLDGLQPPSGLKKLQIEGYRGQDFPRWASGNTLMTDLPNLITVSIDGCGHCTTLPPFSRLRHLRCLTLRFMNNVQFFESSDSPSTSASLFFPSLQELTLHSFYSLKGWWKEETQVPSASFSCLQKLKIWSCPNLTSMPLFPKVEVLDMQNINEKLLEFHNAGMTGSELQTSTAASTSCPEITTAEPESSTAASTSCPEITIAEPESSTAASTSCQESTTVEPREHSQYLQDLKAVQIKSCPRLNALALVESSKNLKKLVVEKLDILSSLTEVLKQLTVLEELEVASCKDLDFSSGCQVSCNGCKECDVPWKFLSKLQRLSLRELPKLVTLPAGLSQVTTLRTLCISICNNLSTLPQWVSNLSSLQHLKLEGCPAITMLPEGLKVINSLVKVDIIECPQLIERCREGGEDRYKIQQARVLCHKSWRYLLMSEANVAQKPKEKGNNVVVHSEDPSIQVNVTVRRQ